MNKKTDWIIVRGAGDLATGTIYRLSEAGYKVLVLESEKPSSIRRQVSFSEAVYEGMSVVEGKTARKIMSACEAEAVFQKGEIPVLVDPDGSSIEAVKPAVLIDAIIAKKNLGTNKSMAPFTIALGPGFRAGTGADSDVDAVVETARGHNLGRIIRDGMAKPNTGVPGMIGGYSAERVIHAPEAGIFRTVSKIGDIVEAGQVIAYVEPPVGKDHPADSAQTDGKVLIPATISGLLRGLLRDGYPIPKGFKIADIDPRKEEITNCFTISDKARCIAGSVLELVCSVTE